MAQTGKLIRIALLQQSPSVRVFLSRSATPDLSTDQFEMVIRMKCHLAGLIHPDEATGRRYQLTENTRLGPHTSLWQRQANVETSLREIDVQSSSVGERYEDVAGRVHQEALTDESFNTMRVISHCGVMAMSSA